MQIQCVWAFSVKNDEGRKGIYRMEDALILTETASFVSNISLLSVIVAIYLVLFSGLIMSLCPLRNKWKDSGFSVACVYVLGGLERMRLLTCDGEMLVPESNKKDGGGGEPMVIKIEQAQSKMVRS